MSDARLPVTVHGPAGGDAPVVVLLHGFGGSREGWAAVQERLADARTLAFDLPEHGEALGSPHGPSTIDARNAVLREIGRLETPVHLVGHSRGGAIAVLAALKAPERIASLTCLAPGGFGPKIADDALGRFASARSEAEVRDALGALYAPARPSRRAVAAQVAWRKDPRAVPAMEGIAATLAPNGVQGTLDLERLRDAPFPVLVAWGERDAVLPAHQARAVPGARIEILEGAGHMLPMEAPDRVAVLIRSQFGTNHS